MPHRSSATSSTFPKRAYHSRAVLVYNTVPFRLVPPSLSSSSSSSSNPPLRILPNDKPTPQQNRRLVDLVMLITQRAHPARLHDEVALAQRHADPADGKRPENVAVANDQHVAVDAAARGPPDDGRVVLEPDLADEGVDAGDNVRGGLAAGAAVGPDVPGRGVAGGGALGADLRRRDALVGAVVPLADQGRHGDFGVGAGRAGGGCGCGCGCGGGVGGLGRDLPGVRVVAAEVEEFERLLGAGAGGDESRHPHTPRKADC